MPAIILTSKLCPKNMESTVYALLAGFQNFGQSIAQSLGLALQDILGIHAVSVNRTSAADPCSLRCCDVTPLVAGWRACADFRVSVLPCVCAVCARAYVRCVCTAAPRSWPHHQEPHPVCTMCRFQVEGGPCNFDNLPLAIGISHIVRLPFRARKRANAQTHDARRNPRALSILHAAVGRPVSFLRVCCRVDAQARGKAGVRVWTTGAFFAVRPRACPSSLFNVLAVLPAAPAAFGRALHLHSHPGRAHDRQHHRGHGGVGSWPPCERRRWRRRLA